MASLTFYGGVGAIGGNKILLRDGETRIFLDFGLCFDKKAGFYEDYLQPRTNNGLRDLMELGVTPSIDGVYRGDLLEVGGTENLTGEIECDESLFKAGGVRSYDDVARECGRPFVQAVLISHSHLDHFQHVSLLDEKIPVYCSDITRTIIEVAEAVGSAGFESEFTVAKKRAVTPLGSGSYFPGSPTITTEPVQRRYVTLGGDVTVEGLRVRSFPVDHSVPGALAFLVTTSDGRTVAYTGDLRFHGTRSHLTEGFRESLRRLRPEVLICEGTRIDEAKPDSEASVEERCTDLMSQTEGLAMVGFAWKDVTRYQTMKRVAERTNRTLVISPKLAFLLDRLKGFGELDITPLGQETAVKVYLKRKGSMLYSKGDYVKSKYDAGYKVDWDRRDLSSIDLEHFHNGIRAYHIRENPSGYLLHLDYYDLNELIDLSPPPGSTYIRACSEPFNEEMQLDHERLKRWLERFGINAPEHEPQYVHASGHASGPEIKQFIRDVIPGVVFPVHTTNPQAFADVATPTTRVVFPEEGKQYDI